MSIFNEGYTEELSLTDDELFGEAQAAEQEQAEENDSEPPQNEEAAEAAPDEPVQPAEDAESEQDPAPETVQPASVEHERYAQLQTAYQQRNEYAKQLEAKLAELQRGILEQGKPLSEEERQNFVNELLENPQKTLSKYLRDLVQMEAQQVVGQALQPIQQRAVIESTKAKVEEAQRRLESKWPEAAQPTERLKVFTKLGDISQAMTGSRDKWTVNPELFMQTAAMELYGAPKEINQAALDKVAEEAKAAAIAELQARDAAKAGLNVSEAAPPNAAPNEDDQIIKDMQSARMGGIFL